MSHEGASFKDRLLQEIVGRHQLTLQNAEEAKLAKISETQKQEEERAKLTSLQPIVARLITKDIADFVGVMNSMAKAPNVAVEIPSTHSTPPPQTQRKFFRPRVTEDRPVWLLTSETSQEIANIRGGSHGMTNWDVISHRKGIVVDQAGDIYAYTSYSSKSVGDEHSHPQASQSPWTEETNFTKSNDSMVIIRTATIGDLAPIDRISLTHESPDEQPRVAALRVRMLSLATT